MLDTDYKFGEVHALADQVEASADRVHVKHILSTTNGGVSLLAFKAGQKLDEHVAPADVLVYAVEGQVEFTILDTSHTLRAGEFLLLGENVRHKVEATTEAKIMLAKVKA